MISVLRASVLTTFLALVHGFGDNLLERINLTAFPWISSQRFGRSWKVPDSCLTNDGFTGTCMSRFSCRRQSGTASGYCGTYGVCCEINLACDSSSKQKRIVIKNPAVLPSTGICNYIIEPYSANVCQLRIDFEKFSLQQPQVQSLSNDVVECRDRLILHNNLVFCGNNEQQHIYLPFSFAAGNDHVQLRFNLPNRWAGTSWRMVVTQLECPAQKRRTMFPMANSFAGPNTLADIRDILSAHNNDLDLLAPPGCLQYHTERTGEIRSFNYNNGMGPYLPDMSYAICFKRLNSDTMMQFTVASFELAQQRDPETYPGFDEECHGTVTTQMRKEDYLMIPRAILMPEGVFQPTYFCGTALKKDNVILSGTDGPLAIYFNSDSVTDDTNRGFLFHYRIQ